MDKLINAIIAELEQIAKGESETGNYWINDNYNVFAFHENNGDGDEWISVKLEQYDNNEECVNSVNDFFNKPLYNNMMIELSKEV
jgi:hypothetical protein